MNPSKRTVEQAVRTGSRPSLHTDEKSQRCTAMLHGYREKLSAVIAELGDIEVQKLTKRHIDDLVGALRAGGLKSPTDKVRKPWTPRSVNYMLGLLTAVMEGEAKQGHVVRNVAALVDRIAADPKKPKTLTPEPACPHIAMGANAEGCRCTPRTTARRPPHLRTLMHLYNNVPAAVIAAWLRARQRVVHDADLRALPAGSSGGRGAEFGASCHNWEHFPAQVIYLERLDTASELGGRCRIRTCVGVSRRIYSPLPLAARATCLGAAPRRDPVWCD